MQDNSYSMVAAKWWVEKILEILPAEAFWGKFNATEALNINKFVNSINDGNKEVYIRGLAKRIENHVNHYSGLTITYPDGITENLAEFRSAKSYVRMYVTDKEVEVWDENGEYELIYKKEE